MTVDLVRLEGMPLATAPLLASAEFQFGSEQLLWVAAAITMDHLLKPQVPVMKCHWTAWYLISLIWHHTLRACARDVPLTALSADLAFYQIKDFGV
jgi:hypothetical protein